MSKVKSISKSLSCLSLVRWPHNFKININPLTTSKKFKCQYNELENMRMMSYLHCDRSLCIPCNKISNSSYSMISSNIRNIPARHFTKSYQKFCSTKKNIENTSTIDEDNEDSTDKDQLSENKIEKELKEKIESLIKEVDEYKDKYQRSLADKENLRQRLEKQIQESKQFGIQSFCKDLLEVTDVFRKAIESVPEEKVKEADSVFINLYDGVVMTESHLISVFRRHGLQKIVPEEGEKFNPSIQEAMFEVPVSDGKSPGTVAHVIRSGWKLHERCVRSAQVGVVKS